VILLELTEEELNIIKKAIITEHKLDEQLLFNEKQKKERLCLSTLTKIELTTLAQKDTLIKYDDFENMVSIAKQNYVRLGTEVFLSNKKVEENYFVYLCFLEAFTSWLNEKNLLKRLARFDFTDKRW
jgi:hypothetical protein